MNMERNHSEDINDLLAHLYEAQYGHLEQVKFYLEDKNVDVNSSGRNGFTALHAASYTGHIEIVRHLISRGADVNITQQHPDFRSVTPLVDAVSRGHVEIAKILIQSGAKTDVVIEGRNLLDQAISSNNPEMVRLIISHGFDINRRNDLGMTPLATAMRLKAYECTGFLLENGADYKQTSTSDGFLPIFYGLVFYRPGFYGLSENDRCTELLLKHIKEKEGEKGLVDYLNSNDNSKGSTALHRACYNQDYKGVKLLLECGADPNIRDKKGRKPSDLVPVFSFNYSAVCKRIKALFESNKQHSS